MAFDINIGGGKPCSNCGSPISGHVMVKFPFPSENLEDGKMTQNCLQNALNKGLILVKQGKSQVDIAMKKNGRMVRNTRKTCRTCREEGCPVCMVGNIEHGIFDHRHCSSESGGE